MLKSRPAVQHRRTVLLDEHEGDIWMRKRLGIFVAACFYYSGLVHLARWLMQRSGKRLIILNYHRARGGDLRRHLSYLRRHYRVLHLDEALQEFYGSPSIRSKDRRTLLALTFDDGYHDNYTHAFPVACALRVPITIFLVPGYTENGAFFWWGEGQRLVQRATVEEVVVDGRKYRLQQADEAQQLAQLIDGQARHATSVAARETFLQQMSAQLASATTVLPAEEADRPLSWTEVQAMKQSGWVSFGAHTMHHPVLAYLAQHDELQYEVSACRSVLEERLGQNIHTFAYPIGRYEHIGENAVQAVKQAGYTWAVTTVNGVNLPTEDPYRLKRVLGDVTRHWLVMAAETSGLWTFFAPIWKALLGKGESV